jgi:CubicO group peptidase (beta-lactamase class C family)
MNDQELKNLWQQQQLAPPQRQADRDLPAAMEQRMKQFWRTIFWRDVREVAACIFVAGAFLPDLFRASSDLTKAGCLVLVTSAVFIGCRLVFSKRRGDRLLASGSIRDYLQAERRELEVQIHLLRTVLWWYILPIYIGAVMVVMGRDSGLGFKVSFAISYAVVCAGIWWLNQYAVKKSLLPLKKELDQTLQEIPEPSQLMNKPMNWPLYLLIAVILLSFAASHFLVAQERPNDAELKNILRERIDTANAGVGIVVGIIDEQGIRVISHGTLSRTDRTPVDGDTIFEIGSISKVFTTELLADMVGKGEVKLDDPVNKYLPANVKVPERNGRKITLLDIATQQSGLPRLPDNMAPADGANPYADYTVEQMYEFLSGHTLTRDIGDKYEYSNLGMGLLGHVLALKAGKSYEALVIERICSPLGMKDTSIVLSTEAKRKLATGHSKMGQPAANWDIPTLAGAGALRSSVNDMLKFVSANLKLDNASLKTAFELTHSARREAGSGTKIGLGWHITTRYGSEIIWHNGGTGGYRSFIGFDKKSQRGVVVLTNSENDSDDIGLHMLEPKHALAKVSAIKVRQAVPVKAELLAKYVGRYQLNDKFFFNVRREKDHLQVQLTGQSYLNLFPESETKFFCDVVDAQISFQTDAQGKTKSLTLHQNGVNQVAKKVSDEEPKEKAAAKVDMTIYDTYAGQYKLAGGAVFTVQRQGDRLMVQLTGQPFFEVFPETETKFFYKVVDAQLTFVKDGSGKVTALILHQNGLNQQAQRVK